MSDTDADDVASRFTLRATTDSHFSWIRTRMSLERTLLSWVRTAIALIGFGFTIVQFFKRLDNMPDVSPVRFPEAPRYFGLALIAAGIAAAQTARASAPQTVGGKHSRRQMVALAHAVDFLNGRSPDRRRRRTVL